MLAFCVACLVAGLSVCGEPPLRALMFSQAGPSWPGRPLIFAHRGGGGSGPEATVPTMLATFRRDPAAVIEFDVHRSRDGQLVVIHDATVDRTTNGSGAVAALTVNQLKALDAGYCATPEAGNGTAPRSLCRGAPDVRFPFRGKGYVVPTLEEVLDALPRETFISMELKQPGIEGDVARLLKQKRRLARTIVGSASDDVAAAIKAALPGVPGYLPAGAAKRFVLAVGGGAAAKVSSAMLARDPRYEIFAAPLAAAGRALDTGTIIDAAHCAGISVVYWTIDDERTIERLFRLGADGVFTDYPDRARAVLQRLRAAGVFDPRRGPPP